MHHTGVYKLGPTAAAALMGFSPKTIEGLSDNEAFDLLGNSMVSNVLVVLLTSIQQVYTGPQDAVIAGNDGDESDLIMLADSIDVPDRTQDTWQAQIAHTKPVLDLNIKAFDLGNIQVKMAKPETPEQIKVPGALLGVPEENFWTEKARERVLEWLAEHTRYIVLGLNNAKPGGTSRIRAPQPLVMQPEEYARPEYVPYVLKGVVFDFRDGKVRQVDPRVRPERDYDSAKCFSGLEDVWMDEDIKHTLEHGVGLFADNPAPTIMLGPMQKNLSGNVVQADSQLYKGVAKNWESIHQVTERTFLPFAPFRCDPCGAVPKKHFGELTGENRPTTNKSYSKGAHVLSSNEEIDRTKLAPITMPCHQVQQYWRPRATQCMLWQAT